MRQPEDPMLVKGDRKHRMVEFRASPSLASPRQACALAMKQEPQMLTFSRTLCAVPIL